MAGSVAGWLDQLPGSESLAGGMWRTRVEGANLDGESFVAKKAAKPWRKDDGAPSHWLTASMTTSIGRDFLELSFVLDECSGKVYMVDSSTGWWQDALELGWEDADLSIKMHHQQMFRGTMRYQDVQQIWDSLDIDSYGAYGHWRATMKVKRQDFSASDHQSVCFYAGKLYFQTSQGWWFEPDRTFECHPWVSAFTESFGIVDPPGCPDYPRRVRLEVTIDLGTQNTHPDGRFVVAPPKRPSRCDFGPSGFWIQVPEGRASPHVTTQPASAHPKGPRGEDP